MYKNLILKMQHFTYVKINFKIYSHAQNSVNLKPHQQHVVALLKYMYQGYDFRRQDHRLSV